MTFPEELRLSQAKLELIQSKRAEEDWLKSVKANAVAWCEVISAALTNLNPN